MGGRTNEHKDQSRHVPDGIIEMKEKETGAPQAHLYKSDKSC
jgi:hypothetical protein